MSRFGNLEFDEGAQEHNPFEKPQLKDETHFLAEARTAFENGNFEQGLRLYSRVLEYNPRNTMAWAGQVQMLIELGEFREARLWADKALERFPRDPELLAAKAVALGRAGDLQEALAFSDAAIEERGDTAYIWLARGDVLLARKEPHADFCFEKALMISSGDWFVAWMIGRIRSYYEQFVLALAAFQQAVERNSSHFQLYLDLGKCQQALGFYGPAQMSFNNALQLNRNCSEASVALTRLSSAGLGSRLRGLWRRVFS